PPLTTIQLYINHERADYAARKRAGKRGIAQHRSMPDMEIVGLAYHPHIINPHFAEREHLLPSTWPKQWLGQPITAILKATGGLVRPCPRSVRITRAGEELEMGVPEEVSRKLVQLITMWNRLDPPVEESVEPPAKRLRWDDKVSPRDGSAGGAGGTATEGKAGGPGIQGKSVVPSSDRQLRPRKGTVRSEISGPPIREKVLCWLEELPESR
ncbi:hypothetical protein EV426DRAFT_669477, partial [Tirmania nivea]